MTTPSRMITREPAPARLVDDGRIRFGVFDGAVRDPNLRDARAPLGVPLPAALQRLRLKEWQAVQLGNGRFFFVIALFHAKTMALAQVKVFDRETGAHHRFERKLAPWALRVAQGLCGTATRWSSRHGLLTFDNRFARGELVVSLDLPAARGCPALRGRVRLHTDEADSMVVSLPFGPNRGMYSHKGCFPCSGEIEVGQERARFDASRGFGLLDDHKGYYPYVMRWDWVTGARVSPDARVAFNLTRNDNLRPERYNENALFLDGRIHHLPPVTFSRHGQGSGEYWEVHDREGQVDVRFDVVLDGRVQLNALVVESRYRGPIGAFCGTLRPRDGPTVNLDGAFGMGEEFYLRT